MIGGPYELALATGRDFYEDGMGDEEKLCMPPRVVLRETIWTKLSKWLRLSLQQVAAL